MSFKPKDTDWALKQLWGEFVPPLTPEQIELSLKLWRKIEARKQRERKENEGTPIQPWSN